MGIIYGLLAALSWGVADFFARYATRIIGTYRTLFLMQFFGFVGLGTYLLITGELLRYANTTSWQVWAWAFLAALLNLTSSLALYRAFEIGLLSVVAPIASSYAALTALLAVLSGEKITVLRILGILAILGGVVLTAGALAPSENQPALLPTTAKKTKLPAGVGWSILSLVCFGLTFWVLGFQVTPTLGGIIPVWIIRLTTISVLFVAAIPARQSLSLPSSGGRIWWYLTGVGILDTAAYVLNNFGLATDQVAIVTVLTSLFSAVTIVLAWSILREKLAWTQWLGITIIFAGIALVSLK